MSWRPSEQGLADHTSLMFALQTASAMAGTPEDELFFEELSQLGEELSLQPGFVDGLGFEEFVSIVLDAQEAVRATFGAKWSLSMDSLRQIQL